MQIPHDRLEATTLRALIIDFVTRDGTDYGESETTLDTKIQRVQAQLKKGSIGIVFDAESESFDILTRDEIALREAKTKG